MKRFSAIFLIAIFCAATFGQNSAATLDLSNYGVTIQPDKRLMTVLATLEAIGVETNLSKEGEEFSRTLQKDLAEANPDLRRKLKIFVDQYAKRLARRYRDDLSAQATNENIRKEMLEDFDSFFAKYSRGLTAEEKKFYGKKYEPFMNQVISPFISMAYTLSPFPALDEPERTLDLPAELLEVLDYSILVREFYRTKGMAEKLDAYYKLNQQVGDKMRPEAREMVRGVLDYLHTRPELTFKEKIKTESKKGKKTLTSYETVYRERSFRIVPEILATKGTINFLNIRDNYFAVVPPETDLSSSDVRRGFLQFVLDPLVIGSSKNVLVHQKEIRSLLNDRRIDGYSISPDPFLAVSRSLVAAVDAREKQFRKEQAATAQARRILPLQDSEAKKKEVIAELNRVKQIVDDEALLQLSESYKKGAVFAFYFAEKLRGIENSGFDIASSIDDWLISLKPLEESNRLSQYSTEINRAVAQREKEGIIVVEERILVENPLTEKLLKVEKLTDAKKFGEAQIQLEKLLAENKENPLEQARIYYALGRMVSQSAEGVTDAEEISKRLLKAADYYKNVIQSIEPKTDRALISSTYFALGRIYEFSGQTDYAIKIYDAAIRLGEVEGGAYQQAFDAKNSLIKK